MAKGLEKHKEREQALSLFGKDLARRAKSRCEICSVSGEKLFIYEVAPEPNEPDFDKCILICETCRDQLENPKRFDPNHWRCVEQSIWSEVPAVQVVSVRVLKKLSETEAWATALLDDAYLDPEIIEWADKVSL